MKHRIISKGTQEITAQELKEAHSRIELCILAVENNNISDEQLEFIKDVTGKEPMTKPIKPIRKNIFSRDTFK